MYFQLQLQLTKVRGSILYLSPKNRLQHHFYASLFTLTLYLRGHWPQVSQPVLACSSGHDTLSPWGGTKILEACGNEKRISLVHISDVFVKAKKIHHQQFTMSSVATRWLSHFHMSILGKIYPKAAQFSDEKLNSPLVIILVVGFP